MILKVFSSQNDSMILRVPRGLCYSLQNDVFVHDTRVFFVYPRESRSIF